MEEEKTGISSVLAGVVSMLVVLMSMHYWFSYWYICKQLALFDITPNPIISLEDVTFSYGDLSLLILLMSLVPTSLVLFSHLFADDLVNHAPKFISNIKLPSFSKIKLRFFQKKTWILIVGNLSVAVWRIIVLFTSDAVIKHPKFIVFTALLTIESLLYFVLPRKRKILLFTVICFNFMWGNL
jgi:hypothetical protein